MVRPGPTVSNGSIDHRAKRARLMRRAFIHVNDEAGQHHERGEIVNDKTYRDDPSRHRIVEPHQDPGNQEQNRADSNSPEVKLLTAIKKPDVVRFDPIFVRSVLSNPSHPTSISFAPGHRGEPIDELE